MTKSFLKFLSGITSASLLLGAVTPTLAYAVDTDAPIFDADVNQDGEVDHNDVQKILDVIAGFTKTISAEDGYEIYDANHNGFVDPADALAVSQFVDGSRKSLPAPYGNFLDNSIGLSCTDTSCFVDETASVQFNIVDWNKDIAAYDFIFHADPALGIESVNCNGNARSVIKNNTIRIFGLGSDLELNRGKIASIQLSPATEGDFRISLDASNIYDSNLDYYPSKNPQAIVSCYSVFAPVALEAAGVSSNSACISWEMPFSDSPVTGFAVYRDQKYLADTVETTFYDTELDPDTEYTYTVCAYNQNGAQTEPSEPLTLKTASPVITNASFPDDSVSYASSQLTVEFEQSTLLSALQFDFSADNKVVHTEELKLEGRGIQNLTQHINTAPLASGDYLLTITATDIDSQSDSYSLNVSIRNEQPVPLTLTAHPGSESVTLTWNIAAEPDVVKYHVYRQAPEDEAPVLFQVIEEREKLDFTDTMLDSTAKYTYGVTAVNSYGTESEMSNLETVQPEPDTTAPQITLFLPKTGSATHQSCNIRIEATDNSRMGRVECYISDDEGETWKMLFTEEGGKGVWALDTTKYPDGIYHFKAAAYDAAGNECKETYVNILKFDNTAPSAVENIRLVELYPTTVTLGWADIADQDFAKFLFTLSYHDKIKTYTINNKLGITLENLTPGQVYSATVAAIDQCGNVGPASEPFSFETPADITAPVVTKLIVPGIIRNNGQFRFKITATDTSKIATYYLQYSQDQTEWKSISRYDEEFLWTPSGLVDGVLYVRAYAEDIYHNAGDPEAAKITEIIVDNTAPQTLPTLSAQQTEEGIQLSWNRVENEPEQSFILQRSTYSGFASPATLVQYYTDTVYTDTDTFSNRTYYYRIAVVDEVGNVSGFTEPIEIYREKDSVCPEITDCYFSNYNNVLTQERRTIQFLAKDNEYLERIELSYSLDGSDTWTKLSGGETTASSDSRQLRIKIELPDAVLEADTVTLRAIAYDYESNPSEAYEKVFTVDRNPILVENLTVTQQGSEVVISWDCPYSEAIRDFSVERKIGSSTAYTIQSKIKPETDKTSYSISDTRLENSGSYVYSILVNKTNGVTNITTADPYEVQGVPRPNLICDTAQTLGAAYYFDATGSEYADEITSLVLDYGDGATDTASQVSAAKFQHTYAEAGTYTATLTCTNAAGISKSTTAKITVEDATQLAKVQIQVKTTDGENASNIAVYMDVGTDQQMQYLTDKNGIVSFYASEGSHDIGVFGNNYLPATKTVSLIAGAENKVDFTVVRDQLVDANFEITRMTLEEIKAAGIDVTDPDNINIVKVDIRLKYEQNIEDSPSQNLSFIYDNNSGTYHLPPTMTDRGYSIQAVKTNSYTNQIETIALMHIPPEVHSLKEFFNVKMIVINNADASFTLEDCTTTIHVPDGLTLMEENASPRTVSLGNIAGQSSAEVNWILRGDVEGKYHISAGFQAVLSKFNQPVSYVFDAEQEIEVLGKKALDITINIHPVIRNNCTYAEIRMLNIADFPIYQVGAKLEDGTLYIKHGDNNTSKAVICESAHYDTRKVWTKLDGNPEMIETLLPGEVFSLIFRISNKSENFKQESFERIKGSLEAIMPDGAQITTRIASVIFQNVDSIFYGIPFDAETQYLFAIRNKARQELANTEVTVYTVTEDNEKIVYATGLTDERGRFIVPRGVKEQRYYIEVAAEGYRKYTEPYFYFSPSQRSSTFTLTGDFLEYDYKLQSASIATVKTCYADILRKQYILVDDDENEFEISVVGVEGITEFQLWQADNYIASCKANSYYGGTFESLDAAYFDVGQPVYVEAYLETGDYIKTMLGLKIFENPNRQSDYLKKQVKDLLDHDTNTSFEVPKDTPLIGGVEFTIDLDKLCNLPIEVEFSGVDNEHVSGKYFQSEYAGTHEYSVDFAVAVNLSEESDDNDKEKKEFKSDEWKRKIAEAKNDAKALQKYPVSWFSLNSSYDSSDSTDTIGDFCFALLLSGSYDLKDKSFSGDIDLAMMYEISGEIASFQIFFGPAPVYIKINGSLGFQLSDEISCHSDDGITARVKASTSFELSLKACLGYTFGKWAIGAGGKLILGIDLSASIIPLKMLELKGTFKGGLSFDYLFGESYINLVKGDYIIYTADPPDLERALTRSQLLALGFSEKDIDAGIQQVSVSYPSSVWNGNWTDAQPLNQLASHTAATLPQKLVSYGDTAMLIWNARDNDRGSYNAKHLVYAIYDKENGCWSEPKSIDSNQQSEIISSVIETPQGIYLAYLEADRVYEADETIDIPDYFNRLTLKTARYDAQTDSFTDHTAIPMQSDSHSFGNAQFVTDQSGTTYLFWNESNDEQLSSLCYATRTETGWSEPTVLLDEIPGLSALACTTSTSGKPVAAYLSNPDADTVKFNNAQLTICDMDGTTSVLDEGSISGLTGGTLPQGGSGVMWVRDGKLFASSDLSTPVLLYQHNETLMSDDYAVIGDQVFFTALSSESAQLLSASYNPDTKTLNAPVVISEADDSSFHSPQAITLDNQTIYTLGSLQQNDAENAPPVTGMLLGGTIPEKTDITLSNISYEIADAAAGKPLNIGLDIQNNGTTSVNSLKAALVDADGKEYAPMEYSDTLLPGESKNLEYAPQLPDDCMKNSYQVRISTTSEDANPDDNIVSIPLCATDFSIESSVEYDDDLTVVSILVRNNGKLPSKATVLASNSSGETLRLLTDIIEPGASMFYTLDGKELLGEAYRDFVTLTVQSELQDYDPYNDKTTIILSQLGMNDEVMGDIDFNGVIDSDDSNLILKQYLTDLVGTDPLLTQTQIYLSDINDDKAINADDANLVLLYYLETMLDNTYDSISDFYESLKKGGSGE